MLSDEGEAVVRASMKKGKERLASARSPSERSWWAGKILQHERPDTDEDVERLREVCLRAAKQTFLSPRVYGMVTILDEDDLWLTESTGSGERWKIDDFVRAETGWTLDWRRIASEELFSSHLSNRAGAEEEDEEHQVFLKAAPYLRRVSLLLHREWFSSMPPDRFVELYGELLGVSAWPRFIQETYALMHEGTAEQAMLAFCLLASAFERTLGDVYASCTGCSEDLIPRKLNELLVAEQIVNVIGAEKMFFIRLFIGPLSSLNLRNLLWHGFLVPPEFSSCYTSLMMLIYLSVSRTLREWGQHSPRPLINLSSARYPNMPPSLHLFQDEDDYQRVEQLFERSFFVMNTQRPVLREMLRQHQKGNYINALVLLFPQFEQCLRRVFAIVNNCPEKVLSAETDVLYTTLDILLATSVDGKENMNMIYDELGDEIMNVLLDTFVWDESIRIRDVLAHGAALPDSVPVQLVDSAFAVFIVLCFKYDVANSDYRNEASVAGDQVMRNRPYAFTLGCDTIARSFLFVKDYQPAYHPRAHLKARMRQCYEKLLELKALDEKIKISPVPNGLPVADESASSSESTSPKEAFSLARVEVEAAAMAQQLQDAIISHYGGLCFFPPGFRPVDFVISSRADDGSDHRKNLTPENVSYRVTAHFSLREKSKVEILSMLADEVATFLREVSEKYTNLYELVVSRKAWKRHRVSFVQIRDSCSFMLLAAVMMLLVADECVQSEEARGDFALLCKNCSGSLASCAKSTKWKRIVELFSAFLGFHTMFDFRKSLLSQKEALKFDVKFTAYMEQVQNGGAC